MKKIWRCLGYLSCSLWLSTPLFSADFCSLNPDVLKTNKDNGSLTPLIAKLEANAEKLLGKNPPSVMEKEKAG